MVTHRAHNPKFAVQVRGSLPELFLVKLTTGDFRNFQYENSGAYSVTGVQPDG